MVKFKPEDHSYHSEEDIQWQSVSQVIKQYKKPFDAEITANKVVKNKKSKWYGKDPKIVQTIWTNESNRSTDLGNWYHNKQEKKLLEKEVDNGLVVVSPIIIDGIKHAPEQKLEDNHIYPEHFMYLKSAKVCGQSDRVQVINNQVDVIDFKTNKKIDRNGFMMWNGPTMLQAPLNHLEECNYNTISLQLSFYAYMIQKHNPLFTIRDLIINHIKFEKVGDDEYGYPIVRIENGEPIVKDVEIIKVPYLKSEIRLIIETLL